MNEYLPPPELHALTGRVQPSKQAVWDDLILMPNAELVKQPNQHPSVKGGIYALFDKDDGLLYIGKAINLNLRINGHSYANKLGFLYYSAIDVPTDLMKDVEIAHIYALNPPGNILYERANNQAHDEFVEKIRKAWGI